MLRLIRAMAAMTLSASICGLVAYTIVQLRVIERTRTDLALLEARVTAASLVQQETGRALRDELNAIERTLYATPPGPRPPSVPQAWEVNRDRELRRRIEALERWRWSLDGR